jgi:hypothetical protein
MDRKAEEQAMLNPTDIRATTNGNGASDAGPRPTANARATLEDDRRLAPAASTAVGVLRPVAVVLTIGLIFVTVYLSAFHAPRPHHLPVAAVGTTGQARSLSTSLNHSIPGGFTVTRVTNEREARDAIEHRRAYAALVADGRTRTLLYAGANGPSVTSLLDTVFVRVAGRSIATQDVRPAAAGDTRGLAIFYAAFGLILAGLLFGMFTYQAAPRLELRVRLLSLALFGAAGGALAVLIAKAFGAMPGPYAALAAVIALMAIAAGAASMTLIRLLGGAGVSVGAVVLVILGNSTSGGVLPRDFLPGWLHPLSQVLPVGVGVRAVDGLAYFRDDGLVTGLAVLLGSIAICVAALYVEDTLSARRSRVKRANPAASSASEPLAQAA